ncbi:MAG TPA: HEAT repeat domain-containing protein, partial [Longimicrobium sp.]|nr:HEAT repeat domain-containing protein [Longimicrobium sp.]
PTLSFGVARRQLVIEGVATDPENHVLRGMAERLHRHRIGAATLRRGLSEAEASAFLAVLARRTAEVTGTDTEWMEGGWPHVRLHSLSFDQLELAEEDGTPEERADKARAALLWLGLARAALASDGPRDGEVPDASLVAAAIEAHPRAEAYDQVIVGYLLQLAEELSTEGSGGAEVRRRMSEMVARLDPATLRRLVEMGGDLAQRRRFLLNASHGFAAAAVVRLVEATARASGQTLSHSMTRLLSKLAVHAEDSGMAGRADAALREQVERLLNGWTLEDPNPEAYRQALEGMSRATPDASRIGEAPAVDDERIVQMALEVGADGPALRRAIDGMAAGHASRLATLLDGAPGPSDLVDAAWGRLCTPDAVRALLRGGADAGEALNRVLERMGADAAPALLDEMADSPSRAVRRAALDRLAGLGAAAVPHVAARLGEPRWFVLRNLLAVLAEAGTVPAGVSPAPYLRHGDARVRREAFKLAFRLADERGRALGIALTDPDPQVQRLALGECLESCPAAVLPLVTRRVDDRAGDPELRALAIRVLGASGDPMAVQRLLRLASSGRTLLGRVRLAPRSPEMLAALTALARGWGSHPAAAPVLAEAMRSPDPEVLRAVLLHRELS